MAAPSERPLVTVRSKADQRILNRFCRLQGQCLELEKGVSVFVRLNLWCLNGVIFVSTRSDRTLLGAPGRTNGSILTTSNKNATRNKGHRY